MRMFESQHRKYGIPFAPLTSNVAPTCTIASAPARLAATNWLARRDRNANGTAPRWKRVPHRRRFGATVAAAAAHRSAPVRSRLQVSTVWPSARSWSTMLLQMPDQASHDSALPSQRNRIFMLSPGADAPMRTDDVGPVLRKWRHSGAPCA